MRVAIVSSPDPASPTGRRRDLGLLPMDAGGSQIFGRPIVVAGRLPDERQADEAVIDEELAARRHLGVGSRWRVGAYTAAQLEQAAGETSSPPAGSTVKLRIVGIVRHPFDLLPAVTGQDNLYVNRGDLYLTPAYWQRYGPDLAGYGVGIGVVLDRGQALENEYFHRKERELIEKMKARFDSENAQTTEMNCPKCDGKLVETDFENIKIDACNKCNGVWFDAGELAQIVDKNENSGWLSRIFG